MHLVIRILNIKQLKSLRFTKNRHRGRPCKRCRDDLGYFYRDWMTTPGDREQWKRKGL